MLNKIVVYLTHCGPAPKKLEGDCNNCLFLFKLSIP